MVARRVIHRAVIDSIAPVAPSPNRCAMEIAAIAVFYPFAYVGIMSL